MHITTRKLNPTWCSVTHVGTPQGVMWLLEFSEEKAYQKYLTDDVQLEGLIQKYLAGERTLVQFYDVVYAVHETLLREVQVARQGHDEYLEGEHMTNWEFTPADQWAKDWTSEVAELSQEKASVFDQYLADKGYTRSQAGRILKHGSQIKR